MNLLRPKTPAPGVCNHVFGEGPTAPPRGESAAEEMTARSMPIRSLSSLLVSLWTAALLVLFLGDCRHLDQTIKKIALIEARAYIGKEHSIQNRAAFHSGIYGPVSNGTLPDPHLVYAQERDIQTRQGRILPLMNPARVIREVMSTYEQDRHVHGHLTSLSCSRKETAPDQWEKMALLALENGNREVREFTHIDGQLHLRIMTPLTTEAQCLKCHDAQGGRIGDIRGGVSLSLPMEPYLNQRRNEVEAHAISFGLLWLLGGTGLWMAASKLTRVTRKRDEAKTGLRVAKDYNQTFLENALTGIYISQDNMIKFGNAKFVEIHGFSLQELIGMPSRDLIHPLDREFVSRLYKERMQGRKLPEEYEIRCIKKNGKTIWVQRRNAMITYEGRPAVLGNEIDITLKKQAEEELKASEAQLKRLVARLVQHQEVERKSIAFEIHEEVAQSLSAIKMSIESSLSADADSCVSSSGNLPSVIERIKQTIDLIRRLTRRLSPIMLEDLGIKTSIAALCRESSETGKGNDITTHVDIDERLVPGDLKIVIYRVLEELLILTASPGRDDQRTVSLDEDDGKITLVVRKTGPQASQVTPKTGRDIGMAVITHLTESFGGSLAIESGENNQSTITVQWPLPAAVWE